MAKIWRFVRVWVFAAAGGALALLTVAVVLLGAAPTSHSAAATSDPADLSVTISDSPDPVTSGATLTYTVLVHNAGPDPATNTVVTDGLPGGVTLVSATATGGGTCALSSGKEICNLGTVTTTTDRTITIKVTVKKASGSLTDTASVTSDVADPTPSNNLDSETTTIKKPPKPPKAAQCHGETVTILGTAGPDTLFGTNGDDVISALQGDDTIYGLRGGDIVCGGSGTDAIRSGPGNDLVIGGSGSDFIFGRRGDDLIFGGHGRDRLRGGNGDDLIGGGPGFDRCHGGRGLDRLRSCERGR
jgi:uncharacterized repeat protein (TIGR01451 family)